MLLNQTFANPWLDIFFSWISQRLYFSVPLLLAVMAFFIWCFGKDGFKFWLLTILFIGLGDQLGTLLKHLTEQARPCAELGEVVRRVDSLFYVTCSRHLNGMPSNHALNFFLFAVFTGAVLQWRGWLLGFGLLAILVTLSRVYLGVHYPSQITAGALIGASLGVGLGWLSLRYIPFVRRVRLAAQSAPDK
jgi:undecaprenyl-diphosphatase